MKHAPPRRSSGCCRCPLQIARTPPLLLEAWTYRRNLIVHDAVYIVLAKHLDAPVLTGDRKMAGAPKLPVQVLHLLLARLLSRQVRPTRGSDARKRSPGCHPARVRAGAPPDSDSPEHHRPPARPTPATQRQPPRPPLRRGPIHPTRHHHQP